MLDGIGQRYGQRPSSIIGINDENLALDFDIAVAVKASNLEKTEIETSSNKPQGIKKVNDPGNKKLKAQIANLQSRQLNTQESRKKVKPNG